MAESIIILSNISKIAIQIGRVLYHWYICRNQVLNMQQKLILFILSLCPFLGGRLINNSINAKPSSLVSSLIHKCL